MKEEVKNIYQAINAIMVDLKPIAKGRKNTQQNYQFRGVDDAMNAFQPLMAKHGVFPTISKGELVQADEVTSKSGTQGYHYVTRYTVTFYALDGTHIDVISDGEAIDYGDKASNKAMSVAYREALFKTFVVPFGNDDIENHSHDIGKTKGAVPADVCKDCGRKLTVRKDGTGSYCSGRYPINNPSCPPKPKSEADEKIADEVASWPEPAWANDPIPTITIDDIK